MANAMEIIKVEDVHGYLDENGTVWLNVEDVARGLGFTRTAASGNMVVRWERVNSYLKEFGSVPTSGHETKAGDYIPENIFYRLAMKASNAAAKSFQAKVADEILPSIRKHGFYATEAKVEEIVHNPEMFIEHLITAYQRVKSERDDLHDKVIELKPKADYCEKILQCKGGLAVTIIAKDYGMGAVMFNELLRSFKVQYKVGRTWVLNQKHANKGYTVTKTVQLREGFNPVVQTLWTQKGRMFLYNELAKHGILPLCEREEPMEKLF